MPLSVLGVGKLDGNLVTGCFYRQAVFQRLELSGKTEKTKLSDVYPYAFALQRAQLTVWREINSKLVSDFRKPAFRLYPPLRASRQCQVRPVIPSGPNATTMKCGILTIVLLKVDSNCELYHRPAPLNVARLIGKGAQNPA